MVFGNRNLFSVVCVIFLWRLCKIKAYVDVCEQTPTNVYCNCEVLSYREKDSLYRVSCILLQDVKETDSVWRSLGDSQSISHLRLEPRLPIKLEYIPSDELRRMPNLRMLKVQEGALGTLKSFSLSNFKSLEELELEGNEIEALEPYAISNMTRLKKLTLSRNALHEILADSLSDLLELQILFLDRNNISRIETCAFCNLQNLKELELWDNEISDLTEYTFRGLRYLTRLDLYKNKISLLNDKVFHTMPRLVELDLRENMISHIAARAFNGLDKLQTLVLSNNLIKFLPDDVFAPLVNLRSVDLYYNKIEILQKEVLDNIKTSKDEIFGFSFRANPFRCDCVMQWVSTHLKMSKNRRLSREFETVECKLENETMKVLDYLDDADCKKPATKPRLPPAPITNLVTKSTDGVHAELNSQKSKPVVATASAVSEGTQATFLSDVVNDEAEVNDSEPDSAGMNAESFLVVFLALLVAQILGHRREV